MGESRVRPAQKGDTHAAGRLTTPKTHFALAREKRSMFIHMCSIILRTAAHPTQDRLCWALKRQRIEDHISLLPLRSALLGPSRTHPSFRTLTQHRFHSEAWRRGLDTCFSPKFLGDVRAVGLEVE